MNVTKSGKSRRLAAAWARASAMSADVPCIHARNRTLSSVVRARGLREPLDRVQVPDRIVMDRLMLHCKP
ncbi:MAG: hypothetical protein H7Y15_06850 [Pseudonocardia sp.]|nr:hypothetical protein [Pseudonocardia sp.]